MPPLAVNVELLPMQIIVGDALAVIVGLGIMLIEMVVVFEQEPLFPVTVYAVVIVGVTTILAPVKAPGFQVYVVAPDAVKVADVPAQIAVAEATAVTVRVGFTVKFNVLVAVQPNVVLPTTV